jgi:hypothetical protein
MSTGHWHIQLHEELERAGLVRWEPPSPIMRAERPTPPSNLLPLLSAMRHLAFRAGEPGAWATPLGTDPIAFLLDAVDEAVNVWTAGGALVYSNRAAADLDLERAGHPGVTSFMRGNQRFERRCLAFDAYGTSYLIEVVRELR